MIVLETDKIEKAARTFKRYWQEIIIVALVYGIIFVVKENNELHIRIETMQQNDINKAQAERNFYRTMDFKLLKLSDSILKNDTTNDVGD